MAYDEKLARRIERILSADAALERKKMFGGLCYLWKGNMLSGIYRDRLILRLGERGAAEALKSGNARPMDITGRPIKGWVMVKAEGFRTDDELREWLEQARAFAGAPPPRGARAHPGLAKESR